MRDAGIIIACTLLLAACTAPDDTHSGATAASVAATATTGPVAADTAGGGKAADMAAVRDVVTRFGAQLRQVSTLAPADAVREQVREHYAGLVTPGLLQAWLSDPSKAPGRDVSSPWPDAIDIRQVRCASADTCEVQGGVRYATSVEVAKGGVADQKAVTLTLKRGTDGWRIDAVRM